MEQQRWNGTGRTEPVERLEQVNGNRTEKVEAFLNNDQANVAVLPPLPYLLIVIAGVLLHLLWQSINWFPDAWIGHAFGWPIATASGLLAIWALRTMRSAGENPSVHKPTEAIVATGPYALTRNPMYLSMTVLCFGVSLILNNIWPVILLPIPLIIIQYGVIFREERYLERKFGGEYTRYRARVRRWL